MRYVNRGDPPAAVDTELIKRRNNLRPDTTPTKAWDAFGHTDAYKELVKTLRCRFRNKCAYCESARDVTVDHFWPKSPGEANGQRGTMEKMFEWDNLLPACRDCQSSGCKASKLALDDKDRPLLLNPADPADDPIRYLRVVLPRSGELLARDPLLPEGWMEPAGGGHEGARAVYTIQECLRLNEGRMGADLWRERARQIGKLLDLIDLLRYVGPDAVGVSGRTVRQRLSEALSDRSPYLAGVRQLLYVEPGCEALREELTTSMPELLPLIEALGPARTEE